MGILSCIPVSQQCFVFVWLIVFNSIPLFIKFSLEIVEVRGSESTFQINSGNDVNPIISLLLVTTILLVIPLNKFFKTILNNKQICCQILLN